MSRAMNVECDVMPASAALSGSSIGFVHSFETSAAADGPGVRFVLFMTGCPFRCLYCHNPDTWRLEAGRPMTVDAVVAEIGKYARFLKLAGGLTVSGGEPLMQGAFVGAVLRQVKRRWGLHVAIDTQGYLAARLPDRWFDDVDLVLLDIKHINPDTHRRLTGMPLGPTLEVAERLIRLKKKIWIRYVVVPRLSDRAADVEQLADFVKSMNAREPGLVERVEVLPFHKLGEYKWRDLGLRYELGDTDPPPTARAEEIRDRFRTRGLFAC